MKTSQGKKKNNAVTFNVQAYHLAFYQNTSQFGLKIKTEISDKIYNLLQTIRK
ncbi:Hypothetical protein CINCED_3A024510 [Cinara cedri]|uniref:Uncharacterized protein n=1 Tax=Cinara cedri TaxID=506608 RepID=A0A5E4NRI9_9HEMI|nr:Hypothetical protein CINCED_3A024510 [Cinara cedri]